MEIKINFKKIPKLSMETTAILSLWLVFISILFWDGMVIKKSIQVVLDAKRSADLPVQTSGVRFNFLNFDKAINRINLANTWQPSSTPVLSPFTVIK